MQKGVKIFCRPVGAASGRGALPVELISGQLLAARRHVLHLDLAYLGIIKVFERLHMSLGDASYE